MSFLRLGKRNFSIRDSPSKLSSSSPRSRLPSNSPAKRLKFNDSNQLLSSTLLNEARSFDESKLECSKDENYQECEKSLLTQGKPFLEQESCAIKNATDRVATCLETTKVLSKLEILIKQKSNLIEESGNLDSDIEAKISAIDNQQQEIDQLRASRFKIEDYVSMITRGQNEIRDQLNSIFSPGTELAEKFEPIMQAIWSKNNRKFEKKTLEWNCRIDQARSVLAKREEDLNHEMELHKRTLLHHEHLSKAHEISARSMDAVSVCKPDEPNSSSSSREEAHDTEDCIIIEQGGDQGIGNEETVVENSEEIPEVKQENDDDETDVEDLTSEEPRSFTPCQAQRAECTS